MAAFTGWSNEGGNVFANALSGLGQQLGNAYAEQGKKQLLSELSGHLASGNIQGALTSASALGNPDLMLKLYDKQKSAEADKVAYGALNGGGAPTTSAPTTPNVVNAQAPEVIGQVAGKYGLNADGLTKTAWLESRFNPNASANGSSAGGLFQFIDGTAKQYGLTNKFDAAQNADAAARLWVDNTKSLTTALGRKPTDAELYLAHQQGAGGAAKLLANPNAKAADIVGADAVRLNGGDPNMTAGQFAGMWVNKFNNTQIGHGKQQGPMPADTPTQQPTAQNLVAGGNMSDLKARAANLEKALLTPNLSDGSKEKLNSALSAIKSQIDWQYKDQSLPGATIDAQTQARLTQGQKMGLTGAALQQFSLTGQLPKPGEEMTPAQKKISEGFAADYETIKKDGRTGNQSLATINQMTKIANDPNFYTGTGGELMLKAGKMLRAAGINVGENVSQAELFKTMADKMVLDANNGSLGTGVSNSDVMFLQGMSPGLSQSREGNLKILQMQKALAERKIEIKRQADAYIKKNGTIDAGFEEQVQKYADEHPMFNEAQQQSAPKQNLTPPSADDLKIAKQKIAEGVPREQIIKFLEQNGHSAGGL